MTAWESAGSAPKDRPIIAWRNGEWFRIEWQPFWLDGRDRGSFYRYGDASGLWDGEFSHWAEAPQGPSK